MNREDSTRIFGMYNYLTISLWWFVFLSPILSLTAQTNLSWNKTLGGNGFEELQTMIETEDGNFVFFGSHTSDVSGDITQGAYGLSDYWLAKVDQSNGNIIWQNTYGGNLIDNGRVMVSTSDGGFLLGGHSSTGINGTKTTTAFGACWNCIDYWVVKTDADGNQLWDKTIQGSSMGDRMTTLIETSDGGFVLAGYSDSDLALDKSEANIGGSDYWVVKLDADGNQLWDRTLGGTGDEQPFALVELPNGTILVGGLSFSLDDGNRTAPSRGLSDYWVVNLDANGTTLWDQAYGGTDADNLRDMILTNDGGIILIGESYSGAGGEKTAPSFGERDIWMLKIDVTGSLLWDRSIGSTDRDQPFKITQSPNGNFLIASLSKSPAGFDRTEPSLGGADYWFVTTDANGNKIKDAVFGGDQNDNLYYALPMRNGDIILGGITATDTSPQKTEPSRGNNDLWLVKYESTLDFDLGNDTIFCVDGTLNLDVTINPCDCCVYTWEDGSSAMNRNLMIDQDTTIILSVHDGFNSLRIDTINVTATEPLTINLGPDTYLCAGDSILLDAENPGQNYFWLPGNATTQDLIITAGDTYQVTVTDQFGCSYEDEVIIRDMAIPVTTGNPIICAGDSLFLANAWQTTSGMYIDTLNNFVGCDSIVMTDLFVATVDTTRLFANTCVESEAGVFSMTMDNQYFCDSTVITTVTYIEPDTTRLFSNTCVESEAGISSMTMDNQYFCDSTVINTVTYIAPDTTRLFANTCVESEAGIFSMTMDNQYFCDSTVINTVTYIAPDTTRLFVNTCVESEAGVFFMTVDNQYACDSTIINTVTYVPMDTIRLFTNTCNENEAGIFSETTNNQDGCDSTIINTVTYIAPDTVNLTDFTCDENQAGPMTFQDTNIFGCDSTTIIDFIYIAPDTTELESHTCDPAQAGPQVVTEVNSQGCDSVVITTNIYVPAEFINQTANTCDPAQAGITMDTLKSQYGCDSLITTTTIDYFAPDTTIFSSITCDSTLMRIDVENLTGFRGCDSTVITQVDYFAPQTATVLLETCDPAQAGSVTNIISGQAGCDSIITITETIYRGSENTLLSATSCDPDLTGTETNVFTNQYGCDSTVILTTTLSMADTTYLNMVSCNPDSLGTDTLIFTNQGGCDSIVYTVIVAEDLGVDYELTDASCSDAEDGSILVNEVTNGLSPYLFAIDDGSFQSFALFPRLAAGSYTLWVQDADGCTAPYEFDIQAPPPLTVSLPNDTTINVGSFLTLPVTTNQAVDTIFWNESSGINCDSSSCLRPEVQPFSNSVYIVTVANGDGCSASDTTLVNVSQEKPFYIPTAFSPNQDGINDNFVLSPGPNVTMIHSVRIFNRWGALLFELPETLPLQSVIGWDGQFKGQPVTSGVYIYMVDVSFIDGERKIITGDVTVFR